MLVEVAATTEVVRLTPCVVGDAIDKGGQTVAELAEMLGMFQSDIQKLYARRHLPWACQ